uniref:Uncharacterized protein n=1 Tax=Lepeophtheirus salmonis TaxID=72036 RepID=A0A0K2V6G6_LEPSM
MLHPYVNDYKGSCPLFKVTGLPFRPSPRIDNLPTSLIHTIYRCVHCGFSA